MKKMLYEVKLSDGTEQVLLSSTETVHVGDRLFHQDRWWLVTSVAWHL
jgi:hypothetical protein